MNYIAHEITQAFRVTAGMIAIWYIFGWTTEVLCIIAEFIWR